MAGKITISKSKPSRSLQNLVKFTASSTILDPNLLDKSLGSNGPDAAFFANLTSVFSIDTTRVAQGGALELYLPEEPLKFVKSLGAQPKPGTAVLVRLSGSDNKLGYEVVSPKQIRYQASKYEAQKP